MTRHRRRAMNAPEDREVAVALRRGRWLASGLRSLMATISLAIVVLAAQSIAH